MTTISWIDRTKRTSARLVAWQTRVQFTLVYFLVLPFAAWTRLRDPLSARDEDAPRYSPARDAATDEATLRRLF